jgi:penicillin-binding protein 2
MSVFGQSLKGRFAALGLIIVLVLGALLVRLWSLQILSGETFAAQSEDNRVREVTLMAPRGRIFDRNGKPLVANRPTLAVVAAPSVLRDKALLAKLSAVINVQVPEIVRRIQTTKQEALQPRTVAVDVPQHAVSYLSEHQSDFPGVEVQVIPVREYPNGNLAAHVLGYVGGISEEQLKEKDFASYTLADVVGKSGVEREFETVLQGDRGSQQLEVDAKGRIHRVLQRREPIAGRDVQLTIDVDVQRVTEAALANAMREARNQYDTENKPFAGNAGAAVVMDVRTGEIIAMASAPTYDPKAFLGGIRPDVWKSMNATESDFPLNDRAVMYPPASTFKVVTGLAGLELGLTTADTGFHCAGVWFFPGHENSAASWWKKKCWKPEGHGSIDFVTGVEDSCDSVFYSLGYQFYTTPGEKLQAFARGSGFGQKTGIDLPGEIGGRVPDIAWKKEFNTFFPEYQQWLPGDTVNMAIGQGDVLVTPLQQAVLFGAVANGGSIMKPYVLKEVSGRDGAGVMRRALLGVTTAGTAKSAFSDFPVEVAGKTGTAQVKGKQDLAWFAAFAPAAEPKYAVVMVVEQGGHGGSVTGPAVRQIIAQLSGLPPVFVPSSAVDTSR